MPVTTQKTSSLQQSSSLRNRIHPKYLERERKKNLTFPQEWLKSLRWNETYSPVNPSEVVD